VRVLVVEDNEALARAVREGLRRAGMAVDVATSGEDALDLTSVHRYDAVVLDRHLPALSGDEVCAHLVEMAEAPRIIMLTTLGALDDRVEGLALGADDYLAKPFEMRELVARVHALGRRPSRVTTPVVTIGDLVIDGPRRRAHRDGRPLALTRNEFGVLEVLAGADGAVVSAEHLLERVWDAEADPFTNAVRITMMTLRRKLGEPPLIETVRGVGYRLGPST
jgi:DNA-binding response OmpR family regulator